MNQQPKPESKKYIDLISEIQKGEIKIPKFQREFVRSIEQTAKLLDSIIKGYPIGTFIMWETTERFNDLKNIGNFKFPDAKEGVKIQYVLDGQQRMTSLLAAYLGEKIKKEGEKKITDYSEIYVDLNVEIEDSENQVIVSEKPDHNNYISLHKVLRFNEYYSEIVQLQPSLSQKINQYFNIFIGYDFSTIVLRKDDINSAIEVFTRINTGGKKLTLFEIMCAKTYSLENDFDMQERWSDFIDELQKVGYDSIGESIVLHILGLILSRTKECKREVILQLSNDNIIAQWGNVLDSIRKAIHHFRACFNIPVSGLLPYDAIIVPFAYFYYCQIQGPTARQYKLLEEFFWRVALSYRYSSSTETSLAQDIKRVDLILDNEKPQYEEGFKIDCNSFEDLINKDFSAGSSFCKAIMCLLASLDPRDFNSGNRVILNNAFLRKADSKNFHHFFPKAYLKNNNIPNANSVVNITLVSDSLNKHIIGAKAPSRYIGNFIEQDETTVKRSLKSHLIMDYGSFGIMSDDYGVFLEKRAKVIYDELMKRVEGRNNQEDEGENKIKLIILGGESNKVEFKETLRVDVYQTNASGKVVINQKMEFSVAKTICAFMNTDGGILFIGVSDNQESLGLIRDYNTFSEGKQNKDGFELHLKGVIKRYLGDNLDKHIIISFPMIDETEICMVEVLKNSTPMFIKFDGKEEFYIRNGNGSEPKSGSDLIGRL